MESAPSDQQRQLISSFLEATGQTEEIATQFLKATSWKLEEAIDLFLIERKYQALFYQEEQVSLPLPSVRDTLYDSLMSNTPVSVCPEEIWDSDSKPSDSGTDLRLSSLYRAPVNLLFIGSFEEAKIVSSREDLWLLVNLQSTTEFASHILNRDLWSNDAVTQAIESSFVFLQVYDHTDEGKKIYTYYKIDSAPPVVLLIDPITGQRMRTWSGVIEPQSFLEDLMKYSDTDPHQHIASLTRNKRIKTEKICVSSNLPDQDMSTLWDKGLDESAEAKTLIFSHKKEESFLKEFPVLTEEPKGDCDRSLVCTLCVRFPDGRRMQRKFLKNEPIQLLWSFCYSQMEEAEKKAFKLVEAIPGANKTLDYGANVTFDQSGLAYSLILVIWE